jgi:hypothetical protein
MWWNVEDRVGGAVFALVDLVSPEEAQRKYRNVLREVHSNIEHRRELKRKESSCARRANLPLVIPESAEGEDHCTWIVGCTDAFTSNGCIDRLRAAIINVIVTHSARFPHLFEERPTAWLRIFDAMLRLGRGSSVFVKTEHIAAMAKVTQHELETGLCFWHEVGMCLWYDGTSALREYVFHDPVQVSDLLRVLIDPMHVDEGAEQAQSSSMQEAVQCLASGQLTVQMTQVLWKQLFETRNPMLSVEGFGNLLLSLLEGLDLALEAPPASGRYFVPLTTNTTRGRSSADAQCLFL